MGTSLNRKEYFELGGLKFQFSKNGNMKFEIKDFEFYDKIYEWYEICDPNRRRGL